MTEVSQVQANDSLALANKPKLPLLLERAGVRRIKSIVYIPPHPSLLGICSCVALLTCILVGIPLNKAL